MPAAPDRPAILRATDRSWSAWVGLVLVALVACGDARSTSGGQAAARDKTNASDASRVDSLRLLGYAGYASEVSDDRKGGVVMIDAARVAPGYNLSSVSKLCTADLFDLRGQVVHSWRDGSGRAWDHVELLADGDLLVIGSERGERVFAGAVCEDHYVERFSFDGTSEWRLPLRAHHDIQEMSDGNWLVLTASQRKIPDVDRQHDVVDNALAVISPQGKLLAEHSLYDMLAAGAQIFEFQRVEPNSNPKFPVIDLLHANSIELMRDRSLDGKHPIFAPQNILICMRHQDAIVVIDWEKKRAIWSWGRGELSGPHDARVLSNGHVLIFDNGLERGWSRVIELDPRTREIVWQYQADDRQRFYSSGQGASQRLPNGNTLVCNSADGQAFEVTPDGQLVWEYLAPYFNDKGQRASMYRVRRYDSGYVERILTSHQAAGEGASK